MLTIGILETAKDSPASVQKFRDSCIIRLPETLVPESWKRPEEVYEKCRLLMFNKSTKNENLLRGNAHLLHIEFVRNFISAIGILEYLGISRLWLPEFTTPRYFPTTLSSPWKPWHHIYSMCKAGKGKYIVRLFWMGSWRKIIVDDTIPVSNNLVLLPSLSEPTTTKKIEFSANIKPGHTVTIDVELWPLILSKALLKISNLSQTKSNTIIDFDIIHCLTGWFPYKIEVLDINEDNIWKMCSEYTDHYTWPENEVANKEKKKRGAIKDKRPRERNGNSGEIDRVHTPNDNKNTDDVKSFVDGKKTKSYKSATSKRRTCWTVKKSTKKDKSSKNYKSRKSLKPGKSLKSTESSKSTSDKTSKTEKKVVSSFLHDLTPSYLIGVCSDMKLIQEDVVPDFSPCWSHSFLIDQSRNIPLIKPKPLPELPRWKMFRWIDWAVKHGLWPKPHEDSIKCIKMVSNFKKYTENSTFESPSQESIKIQSSVLMIEKLASKINNKDTRTNLEVTDGSIWMDFNKIVPYFSDIHLYFKLSSFQNITRITNIQLKEEVEGNSTKAEYTKIESDKKLRTKVPTLLISTNKLIFLRNEPVYVFCDDTDSKLIVINLAQDGNITVLNKDGNAKVSSASDVHVRTTNQKNIAEDIVAFSYVVIEDYNWQSSQIGDVVTSMSTYGNKSMVVDVKPGRAIFRVWIRCETAFIAHIMSDSKIEVGSLQYILECMSRESVMLMKMCDNISSSYGKLVQKFGTHGFAEALKLFYKSYVPENIITKVQLSIVHENFLNGFIETVRKHSAKNQLQDRIFALRVLFLNPKLLYNNEKGRPVCTKTCRLSGETLSNKTASSSESLKINEKAAIILQSVVKKFFVINLVRLHNPKHPKNATIYDELKQIYLDIFSTSKRITICSGLVRNFLLNNPNMKNVSVVYPILKDLLSTIHFKYFVGVIQILKNNWVPINRYVFWCISPNPITIKICLFCNLSNFIVRVFNNDTREEIDRSTNNVIVTKYEQNVNGYTLFCYGWPDFDGDCNWKLYMATVRTNCVSVIKVPEVGIVYNVMKETYRPNISNTICKWLVTIQQDTVLSLRLSTSYNEIDLRIQCLDEKDDVVVEISGKTNIILPVLLLKARPPELDEQPINLYVSSMSFKDAESKSKKTFANLDKFCIGKSSSIAFSNTPGFSIDCDTLIKTTYFIESHVLHHSWPLTKIEWNNVNKFKKIFLLGPPKNETRYSIAGNKKKERYVSIPSKRKSIEKKTVSDELQQPPYWMLEVVSNVEDVVSIKIDNRRLLEINHVKRKWDQNHFDRYYKSKKLREDFLDSLYLKFPCDYGSIEDYEDTVSDDRDLKSEIHCKSLPALKIEEYYRNDTMKKISESKKTESIVLTAEVEKVLLHKHTDLIKQFQDYYDRHKEDMYLNDHLARCKLLNEFFTRCTNESKDLMRNANNLRIIMVRYRRCAIVGCTDKTSTRHRFPNPEKDKTRYDEWIRICGNPKLLNLSPATVYLSQRVCHTHFPESDRILPISDSDVARINMPCSETNSKTSLLHPVIDETIFAIPSTSQQIMTTPSSIADSDTTLLHSVNVTRSAHLSPKAKHLYEQARTYKRLVNINKKKLTSYRRRLKLAQKYNNLPHNSNLQMEIYNFCIQQLLRKKTHPEGHRFSYEEKSDCSSIV
ncbi:hypothetical protein FQR65_LT13459 [Abscondita terminalis]|nr:hypothetical protein FQR65_LT13459 [Abscondita terminalis]